MHESSVRLTSPALTGCSGNTQLPLTTPCASSGPGSFGAGCRLTPTCHADSPAPHSCFTGRVPLVTSPDPSCCHAGSQHYDLCNKLPGKEKRVHQGDASLPLWFESGSYLLFFSLLLLKQILASVILQNSPQRLSRLQWSSLLVHLFSVTFLNIIPKQMLSECNCCLIFHNAQLQQNSMNVVLFMVIQVSSIPTPIMKTYDFTLHLMVVMSGKQHDYLLIFKCSITISIDLIHLYNFNTVSL